MTRAVLFDVDGTLLDSNDAHARAWVAALAENGHDVPFARIRPMIGMGGDRILPEVVPGCRKDDPAGRAILAARKRRFLADEIGTIAPTAGARACLERVRAAGLLVVIASSATSEELGALLAVGDFAPLVDTASTSDDAERSKPAPDIVHAALAKAHLSPDEAVMVGDTVYDVDAAHRAGVACIAVRCGGNDPASLAGADALYDDPRAFARSLGAPPIRGLSAASTAP